MLGRLLGSKFHEKVSRLDELVVLILVLNIAVSIWFLFDTRHKSLRTMYAAYVVMP